MIDPYKDRRPEKLEVLLKTISRSGVSDVLFSLDRGSKRFSQLMFETKLNPGIIDRHLKALLELGVAEKKEESYELTERGKKLVEILREILGVFREDS
jgi:DNA-binding HxlR family transcriptional regulator